MEKIPENDKILKLAAAEASRIRQSAGVEPSHAMSVSITNLLIGNNNTVLLPTVQSLLDNQFSQALDITPEDSDALECEQ